MTATPTENPPPVCDYEGSGYRTEFWQGQGRNYEDRSERVAIRRLMPSSGRRLFEVGAGFGRLTEMYSAFDQVILFDYSRSLLQEAQAHLGRDERYVYVVGNIYQSPIADGVCDAAAMIRVVHHMADAPAALAQVRRALQPGGIFLLEFANKRNFKAVLRYLLNRSNENPFSLDPYEFVELNFNFHPKYIEQTLAALDMRTERRLALSYLRIGLLKRLLPTALLVGLDAILQPTGAITTYSPSVFTLNMVMGDSPAANPDGALFKCPRCEHNPLEHHDDHLVCTHCGAKWGLEDGIYDFKAPLNI